MEVNEGQAGGSEKSSIHEPAGADVELAQCFGFFGRRICCYCGGKKKNHSSTSCGVLLSTFSSDSQKNLGKCQI